MKHKLLLFLAAMLLLFSVTAGAVELDQSTAECSCSVSEQTGLTVYPNGGSAMPEQIYSAPEDSKEEIQLPDPSESRPVILIVSIAVLVVVVSVSVFIEKHYRNRS